MTQSGQGEEPSARPAREGIVLPSDGGAPLLPNATGGPHGAPGGQAAPTGGQSWDRPWGPDQQQDPATQRWGADTGQSWDAQPSWEQQPQDPRSTWGGASVPQQGGGPLPPEGAHPSPYGTHGGAPQHGAPMPPADEGATQYIPPVPAGPDEGATQYIPPVPAEGATQYIPPVGAGALPPEQPGDHATQYLGRAGAVPAAGPDAQAATQYLPPVPGQQGPAPYGTPGAAAGPPPVFDNLFREGTGGPASTQNLPRFDPADASGMPPGRAAGRGGDEDGGRGRSRVPLIAAVGTGIIVLGIGAGALLGGGGGDSKGDDSSSVAATGPASDSSSSAPGGDGAKAQAVALDKLLDDSGNSRGAVIKAVADVKACQNLDGAAGDLRDAAQQRNELVNRLSGLAVDKLARHGELTAALTSAWKASAAADTHYAAWADQVSGNKKACAKGQAHTTGQTAAGNRASGTASAEKAKAANLWNAIAQDYGLTPRQPTQL
ncbi:hypothetical protein ACIQ6V_21010 [Streptomyces sp. NPDC096198]|uniref:hypothetical protein n=1 Tax=Streptomyces sp. NPDC096198 TaxID=3366080 RepID=UPI00380E4EF7